MKYSNKVVSVGRSVIVASSVLLAACTGNSLQKRGESQILKESGLIVKKSDSTKTPKNSLKSLREIAEYVTKNYESYDSEMFFECLGKFVSSLELCPSNKNYFRPGYLYEDSGLLKRYEKIFPSSGNLKTKFTRLDLGPNFLSDGKINRYDRFKIEMYLDGKMVKQYSFKFGEKEVRMISPKNSSQQRKELGNLLSALQLQIQKDK